jgi:hypothetical protein
MARVSPFHVGQMDDRGKMARRVLGGCWGEQRFVSSASVDEAEGDGVRDEW